MSRAGRVSSHDPILSIATCGVSGYVAARHDRLRWNAHQSLRSKSIRSWRRYVVDV